MISARVLASSAAVTVAAFIPLAAATDFAFGVPSNHMRAIPAAPTRLVMVSHFRTAYPPGEPRVVNIRRAAQLLDHTILEPGERWSMNAALGRRTRARGFVPAPMISGGVLVNSVGGGISQVATTLYNAAFFAGLRLVAHTPHSFYINRYPMGREATISWGGPELVFDNNWKSRLVMRFQTTPTSITIAFYSARLGRSVSTRTSRPYDYVSPRTRYIKDPTLPRGTRRVIQHAGGAGFSVDYSRRVLRPERPQNEEHFRVRYQPIDEVIAVAGR